jgi:GNAT superfamily N-acetyltransferase
MTPPRRRTIDAVEANFWSLWSQFGRAQGCELHEERYALWFETPISVPPYNMVLRFAGGADCDAQIDAIFARYRARGVPFLWMLGPSSRPADLDERLRARGFDEAEPCPAMACDLAALPPPRELPPGVEIVSVDGEHELARYLEFVALRWQVPDGAREPLRAIGAAFRVGEPGSPNRAWLATAEGRVLAKALTHDDGSTVGLYGVATKPEARRLGLARAVSIAALRAARERGRELAVLESSPMAAPLYAALGFKTVGGFRLFAIPNSFYA